MDIKLIRSNKHKGAVFLKVRQSQDHFICKVYPQMTSENTERLVVVIKQALENVPATICESNVELDNNGSMSLGEEQAMRQAGAY